MTSELNDLIARSSVLAFNSGIDAGRREEQKRVFRILDELAMENKIGEYAYISDIKEYIKDEEYK
jgi:hypothetical protein